jgi:methionyl-tRNA formyltransferase
MNIAYFGLPLGALALLADGRDVGLVVLAPVSAPGRRRLRARIGGARVIDAAAAGSRLGELIDAWMTTSAPDLLVSWFWTRRIPERWLRAVALGGIGVHPSLLPRHRGPNPYFWTIDQGDAVTGVTVHRLEASYDTGAILEQRQAEVGARNAWQLARALDRPSLEALRAVVARFACGERPAATRQDDARASYAPEPEGALLRVEWHWPTERVLRRIRALSPVPGLAIELCGQPVFITDADRAARFVAALEPGEAALEDGHVAIRTGDGAVRLLRAISGEGGALEEGETLTNDQLALILRHARPV